jgi:hypothetical protein
MGGVSARECDEAPVRTGVLSQIPATGASSWASLPFVLPFGAIPGPPPSKTTIWRVLTDVGAEVLDAVVGTWLMGLAGLASPASASGKRQRHNRTTKDLADRCAAAGAPQDALPSP